MSYLLHAKTRYLNDLSFREQSLSQASPPTRVLNSNHQAAFYIQIEREALHRFLANHELVRVLLVEEVSRTLPSCTCLVNVYLLWQMPIPLFRNGGNLRPEGFIARIVLPDIWCPVSGMVKLCKDMLSAFSCLRLEVLGASLAHTQRQEVFIQFASCSLLL
jgi:hypothetical protein